MVLDMMNFSFDPKDFKVEQFFSYPCSVIYRISEYDEVSSHTYKSDKNVKRFFEDVLDFAEKKLSKKLMDNKIAFKIVYNDSVFYIGYKDNIYAIGLDLNPYMNSAYTLKL